jgi:hypothetical protein
MSATNPGQTRDEIPGAVGTDRPIEPTLEIWMTSTSDETTRRVPDLDSTVGTAGVAIDGGGDQTRGPAPEEPSLDVREALFNDGCIGAADRIQLPRERITRLRGLMIDLDPGKLDPTNPLFPPAEQPAEFLRRNQAVLDRHPVACDAEVRSSGTGLHLLLWFKPPVELKTAGEQRHWDGLIQLIQATLPSDCNAPGITALTRPVGSINSRNGARVETLRPGSPIDPDRVVEFAAKVKAAPFRVLAGILFGGERRAPCPVCSVAGSSLAALDHVGRCYRCGTVSLATLYETIFAPGAQVVDNDDAEGPRDEGPRRSRRKAARSTTRRS